MKTSTKYVRMFSVVAIVVASLIILAVGVVVGLHYLDVWHIQDTEYKNYPLFAFMVAGFFAVVALFGMTGSLVDDTEGFFEETDNWY
ncbi:hypothetical protein GR7B_00214 [Vibrio phage vB_VcorM_GR7B]|nr:hypothetical protein GR7B_00214 [Vibrio phage vB_VcorM_GR7B]